ncbi:hypothetical protein NV379_02270 [Paenibacillus sp. N1-5-1-14]|uniref:hypothetical protein n=1 Tax=Paenibacillus radicibacter TaxID=2972488 RepID=UPI0021590676|nr:hypothetical protein [Paenibacillus radicibacter]MCR8641472.1 hypothetical protein [Paenibacillus radicibacter]
MDLTEMFKRKGFKYKYVFILGNLGDTSSIKIVDGWEKELISPEELETQKRTMMKNYKLPVINVEVEEL